MSDIFHGIAFIVQMLEGSILISPWHLIEHCTIESFLDTVIEEHVHLL